MPATRYQRYRRLRRENDPNATLLEALVEAGENVWRKLSLFAVGVLHLLFSSDKQWLRQLPAPCPEDQDEEQQPLVASVLDDASPSSAVGPSQKRTVKRVIFVRHAESEWNVVFNRGLDWHALVQFVRACVREWLMLPTQHSVFIDSPLSRRGVRQAQQLFEDVGGEEHTEKVLRDLESGGDGSARSAEKAAVLRYLSSPLPDSIVVTSNLRRAIDTARIGSKARLDLPDEKIHVLSSLQEIGRNIDTLTISDAYAIKPHVLSSALRIEKGRDDLFNLKESHGNKAVRGCGRTRLQAFAVWACSQDADVLVVYGHSLWFRAFCQEYFPAGMEHDAKRHKLANCGVVSFALEETHSVSTEPLGSQVQQHRIIPESFLYVR
ncbi:Histidine phosphatase superfamily, clade-1 [Globisporangium polare]